MKAIRHTFGLLVAIGMLVALPMDATAQGAGSPSPEPSPPTLGVLVTGTFSSNRGDADWFEDTDVDYGIRQRGRTYVGHVAMSDPRLSGDAVGRDNADRYCAGTCDFDTFRADVLWGILAITNHDGTWVGTTVGTSDMAAGGRGVTYYQLAGTGAYEGLSAALFETGQTGTDEVLWSGVIFPGQLAPDR